MRPAIALTICSISLIFAAILCSCTPTLQRLQKKPPSTADIYREKAKYFEKQGELQQSLFAWHIVARLEPDNTEAVKTIQNIRQNINKFARTHFQQGVKYYKFGDYGKALTQFLITLRYKPDHRHACYYLKTRLQNPEQTTYTVLPGDSFTRIAETIYKDPGKAYTIAFFNDLNPRNPLLIGTTLLLPRIDPKYLRRQSNISIWLDQARTAYKNQRYDETLSLTQKIRDDVPDHPKARRLADAAYFNKGMDLLKQKRYLTAVAQFKQVSTDYKGRNQAIAKARRHIKQLALEKKLSLAQEYLRNNAWENVLNATEEILDHDPDNAQAKMLFSNASYNLGKSMLNKGHVAKAVDLLNRIDPSYEDTGQLLSLARARMKSQAETHYRDGVKHFINEDLEMAIKDWKKTLELNPEHPKAQQDIENAQRLLNKLKAFE
jgi:tetratricopeptide (TPR) repeat protein